MTARDWSALSDDALMGALRANASESVLLEGADILTRNDPVPAGVSAAARAVIDGLPIKCTTVRFRCPWCRRFSRSRQAAVADHMTRCWLNPTVRACKTCTHFCQQDAEPDVGLDALEWCDAQDTQLDGIRDHCPLWTLRGDR